MSAKSGKMNRMRRRDMASRLCAASIGIHGSCFADAAVVRTRNMGCIQSHIRPVRCECFSVALRWQKEYADDGNAPKEDPVGSDVVFVRIHCRMKGTVGQCGACMTCAKRENFRCPYNTIAFVRNVCRKIQRSQLTGKDLVHSETFTLLGRRATGTAVYVCHVIGEDSEGPRSIVPALRNRIFRYIQDAR